MRPALAVALLGLFAAACGSSSGALESGALRIVVADAPVEVLAGSTLLVQVIVLGDGSGEAVITSPGLPPFATLSGSVLTLSPPAGIEGDHRITLVASARESTASAVLHVRVTRRNASPNRISIGMQDDGVERGVCPDHRWEVDEWTDCTIHGLASVSFTAWDPEGDDVFLRVSVTPHGSGSAPSHHTATVPSGVAATFELPGLVPGTKYDLVAVAYGHETEPNGFATPPYSFYQGPCPDGAACACARAGRICLLDLDCCSGSCLAAAPDRSECR